MRWTKRGRVYAPDGTRLWAQRYAFPPTPFMRGDDVIRLYVSFCDAQTVGRVGYVDVDARDPARVLEVAAEPVLDVGVAGAFDENGVLPLAVVAVGRDIYLYYVGYQLGMKVRYYQFTGLAVSTDGGRSFDRASQVPVLDRTDAELLNRTSTFVVYEDGRFRMWYVGGSTWTEVDGKPLPVYNIRYLESPDGREWPDEGRVCVDFATDDEHAFGRPFVVRHDGGYRMFYSVRTRSKGYRIGYADSSDNVTWTRRDSDVGIDVSPSGWDSQMVAYASVVRAGGETYMFYNGNNNGETGFGYAVLEEW